MTAEAGAGLIRRIARPARAAEPVTPARAMRQAFARAADRAAGLAVAVLGVADEVDPLDELLGRLEPGLLLFRVERGGTAGLLGLDGEARAALLEAQTLGRPSPHPAEPREPTAVDAALAAPMADAFLREAEEGARGTPLEGWIGAARTGDTFPSPREVGLALPDGDYRALRLTLDLGAGGRQGLALLLLPVALRVAGDRGRGASDWREGLAGRVLSAPAGVTAVLHRFTLTLAEAEALAPGQMLPLAGVTVASVRLEGPGGVDLGPARLGQVAGLRAIRIEAPPPPHLGHLGIPPPEPGSSPAFDGPSWPPGLPDGFGEAPSS